MFLSFQKWDRSHFLENLSGFETDCGMIGAAGVGVHQVPGDGVRAGPQDQQHVRILRKCR